MMRSTTLPPLPKAAASVYEAIKCDEWEGLLALYATTAYDAVHSADFTRCGDAGYCRDYPSSPSVMASAAAVGLGKGGPFRDEKKLERGHQQSPCQNIHSSTSLYTSSSACIRELDLIVREIIGAGVSDEHHGGFSIRGEEASRQNYRQPKGSKLLSRGKNSRQLNNKKTRQVSPARMSATGGVGLSSALDHMLFHASQNSSSHSSSSSNSRNGQSCEKDDTDWEKVMWESASILSNSRPTPNFAVTRQDRIRREEGSKSGIIESLKSTACLVSEGSNGGDSAKKRQEAGGGEGDDVGDNSSAPIFEGGVANATPGDLSDGGTGSGTAQHLACLLDSPFSLAILIASGVNVEARHTAFRRLAVHEAACADSPQCLGLLMELGTRYSIEIFLNDVSNSTPLPSSFGGNLKSSPPNPFTSSPSYVTTSATGFNSFGSLRDSFSGDVEEKGGRKAPSKKKFFFDWHKAKNPEGSASVLNEHEKVSLFTSFPVALRVMWEAAGLLRSGEMTEMDAARYVLGRVRASNRTMTALALQCPAHPPSNGGSAATLPPLPSPFASIPGITSAVTHLFQAPPAARPGTLCRDSQISFVKRNVDGHGNTPLHWAAFKNSVRAMDVLLSYPSVDVDARAQPSGWTPLHDAAYSDAAGAVERLIDAGATIDARSHSGATPLCFAAQEDAPNATRRLLRAGADPSMRCLGNSQGVHIRANNVDMSMYHSRFSGYTPLHYCAHYNAARAARVLIYEGNNCHINNHHRHQFSLMADLLEIPDLNEKLPIHVAVARGSNLVLRELLHGGARVETPSYHSPPSLRARRAVPEAATYMAMAASATRVDTVPLAVPGSNHANTGMVLSMSPSTSPTVITPVSSPLLRAMIPSRPITSSKPWNCLSQNSIDACRALIQEVEMEWTPQRHTLFSPADRKGVVEVLRVGKRLEQVGRGIFLDLWPHVLSFCGRGWFELVDQVELSEVGRPSTMRIRGDVHDCHGEEHISMQCSTASSIASGESSIEEDMDESLIQFDLDGTNDIVAAIL